MEDKKLSVYSKITSLTDEDLFVFLQSLGAGSFANKNIRFADFVNKEVRFNSAYNSSILSPRVITSGTSYQFFICDTNQTTPIPADKLPLNALLELDCRIRVEDGRGQSPNPVQSGWLVSMADYSAGDGGLFASDLNGQRIVPTTYLNLGNTRYYEFRTKFYIQNTSNRLQFAARVQGTTNTMSAMQLYIDGYRILNPNLFKVI